MLLEVWPNMAQELAVVKGERARKQEQMATILHYYKKAVLCWNIQACNPFSRFLGCPSDIGMMRLGGRWRTVYITNSKHEQRSSCMLLISSPSLVM
jgi:hypothetical protein